MTPKIDILFQTDDLIFYTNMTFESLDNNAMSLLHTILHKNYADKSMSMDKLYGFHKSVTMEMVKRGMTHSYVDKLDDE